MAQNLLELSSNLEEKPLSEFANRSSEKFDSKHTIIRQGSAQIDSKSSYSTLGQVETSLTEDDRPNNDTTLKLELAKTKILELERALKESQNERETLHDQLVYTSENLHDAQDLVFSLQPRSRGVTEMEAISEYSSLCGNIENWVSSRLNDVLNDRKAFQETRLTYDLTEKLLGLASAPGREAFKLADTDEYNVTAMVMQFLCVQIFDREFYLPLIREEGALEFLASLEKRMRNLEPRPDLAAYRAWRSETYAALANRRIFESQRSHQAKKLARNLTDMLQVFVPGTSPHDLSTSIRDTIIEPALTLAHKMQLSTDKFSLAWTPLKNLDYSNRQKQPFDCSVYDNVDLLASGRVLKFPASQIAAERGDIKYILDVFPGLVIHRVKADAYAEPKVLRKAKVLVAVVKDGKAWHRSLTGRAERTLLGWVDEMSIRRYAKETSWTSRLY